MKAIVYTEYGSPEVLQLQEVEKPAPGANEILVKIVATTVSAVDSHFRQGDPFSARLYCGLIKPGNRVLGGLLAGEVAAVGSAVTLFKPGDRVFGASSNGYGTHAEYICLPEDAVAAIMPDGMMFEEAAAMPEALTALYFLRNLANTRSGQKVLINGASGAVGTYAIQLACYFGAEVTGVCSSANIDLVKSLGASRVVDYTCEDFTSHSATYDIIFDVVGKSSFACCKPALRQNGIYLTTVMSPAIVAQMLWTSKIGSKKAVLGLAGLNQHKADLMFLKELIEGGNLKSVIDRCYPLEQIVEAHRYVDSGHKKGNVVVRVAQNN